MQTINLLSIKKSYPHSSFKINNETIDVHNCFDCYSITHSNNAIILNLLSNEFNKSHVKNINIQFINVTEFKSVYALNDNEKQISIDAIFLNEFIDKVEREYTPIQLFFSEGQKFNFNCTTATISFI